MTNKRFCLRCGKRLIKKRPEHDNQKRLVCPFCNWIFYNNPRPTVTAIIEKEDKVLLVKRSRNPYKGDWDLAGGFVEPGEILEKALKREVKEEAGLEVLESQYYFNWIDIYKNEVDSYVGNNIGIHFLVKVKDREPKPGDDASEARWFDWGNLPKNIAKFHDILKVIEKRKKDLGIK